jgi:hypothetical protein
MYPDVFRVLGWKNFSHSMKTIEAPVDTFSERLKQKQSEKLSAAKVDEENSEVREDIEMINVEQTAAVINVAEEEACFIPIGADNGTPCHSQEDVFVPETPPEKTIKPDEKPEGPGSKISDGASPVIAPTADMSKLSMNTTMKLPTPQPTSVGGGSRRKSRKPSTTIKKTSSHMQVQVTSIALPGMDQCLGQVYQSTGPVFSDMSHTIGKVSPIQDDIVGESQEEINGPVKPTQVIAPAQQKDFLEVKKPEVVASTTTMSKPVKPLVKLAKVESLFQSPVSTYRCTLKYIEDLLEKRKNEEKKPAAQTESQEESKQQESTKEDTETPTIVDESPPPHPVIFVKSQKKTKSSLDLKASERETQYQMQQKYLNSLRHNYGLEVSACIEQVITLVDYYRDFGRRTQLKELWKPKINKLAKIKASLEENVQSLHLPCHLRKAFIKVCYYYVTYRRVSCCN